MGVTDSLRALHESYAWEVNAAVAEDRMDLVARLADEYTDRALRLLVTTESPHCGRPGCAICAGASCSVPRPRRHHWFGRLLRRRHVA